jgi:hypothetical protein
MVETLKIKAEELYELLDDLEPVEKLNWRHGHRDAYVFEKDGKHWRVIIDVHHEEGWQVLDEETAERVYPHQVTTTVWMTTPQPSKSPEKP